MSSTSLCYKPIGNFLSKTTTQFRPEVRKVKRALFGPIDHVANQKFLEEELEKIRTAQSEKWNFDFQHETPLNPRGDFHWKTATPVKKKSKRPDQVFEGQDLYAVPDLIRPTPIRLVAEVNQMTSPPKTQKSQPQRLITDFMPVKKRSSSDFSKKIDWIPQMERPTKLPRLSELSS